MTLLLFFSMQVSLQPINNSALPMWRQFSVFCALLIVSACTAWASPTASAKPVVDLTSPVGEWQVYSKKGKPKAIVRIVEQSGRLNGYIVKLQNLKTTVCSHCKGDSKGAPLLGMKVIWNLRQDDNRTWDKGYIMDPTSGDVYRSQVKLLDNGQKLQVSGYYLIFSKSRVWTRVQ